MVMTYAFRCGPDENPPLRNVACSHPKVAWTRFMSTDNRPNVTTEVIDLLDKLLRYDHGERLTAAEALSHAYFSAYPGCRAWQGHR